MNKYGEIFFNWENDTFIVKIKGPFNEKSVGYYAPKLQESIVNRKVDKWKHLEIWDDNALGCSKTLALAKEVYDWYEINECVLTAVVISNALQSHIIKDIFRSNAEIFIDKEQAKNWLNTHKK